METVILTDGQTLKVIVADGYLMIDDMGNVIEDKRNKSD
jgi:hypothetical protein